MYAIRSYYDLVYGNPARNIVGVNDMMVQGKTAIEQLALYKQARANGDESAAAEALAKFEPVSGYLGYGYLNSPEEAVPPVALNFYSFRIMVGLGTLFPLLFLAFLFFTYRNTLTEKRWLLMTGVIALFLGYRITSYNVCYTKLLRKREEGIGCPGRP